MKNNYMILLLALFFSVISCGQGGKPFSLPNIGDVGEKPETIDGLTKEEEDSIRTYLTGNNTAGTYTKIMDRDYFNGGYLIGSLDGSYWYVLGMTSTGNALYGKGEFYETGKLNNALEMANNLDNWDPRKIIFLGTFFNNNQYGGFAYDDYLTITWVGHVVRNGKDENRDYDKYTSALHGIHNTYASSTTFDAVSYRDVGLQSGSQISNAESIMLQPYITLNMNFYVEKGSGTSSIGRKSWAYIVDTGFALSYNNARVSYKNRARFGYLLKDDFSRSDKYYLGGGYLFGNDNTAKESKVTFVSDANANNKSAIFNSGDPKGKAVFARGDGTENIFYISVVGTNIREKEASGINVSGYRAKDILIDFDASTYADARSEGFSDKKELPITDRNGNVINLNTGIQNVQFIFLKK